VGADIREDVVEDPYRIAMFLELVRMQLSCLTSLHLPISGDIDWEQSTALWDVLARFTQLQTLELEFNTTPRASELETNLPLEDLAILSSMTSLSSLSVTVNNLIVPPGQYSFVSCLTFLTHLELPLFLPEAMPSQQPRLSSFEALTKLQSLSLVGDDDSGAVALDPPFTVSDCSSLAQLTALTKLQLQRLHDLDSKPLLEQLLSPLQQLKALQLPKCRASVVLPVIAGLAHLTELTVDWVPEPSASRRGISSIVCPSIKKLGGQGPVPVEAFPEVGVDAMGKQGLTPHQKHTMSCHLQYLK
jgi:hypothetical protein